MKIYNKLYILKTTVPNYVLEKIEEWDIGEAILLIHDLEIEDAYAFRFQQRSLEEERIDGRYNIKVSIIKESGTYYLEGYLALLYSGLLLYTLLYAPINPLVLFD